MHWLCIDILSALTLLIIQYNHVIWQRLSYFPPIVLRTLFHSIQNPIILKSHAWKRNVNEVELTPSDQSKSPKVLSVREEGHEDEAVEVQTLHQDPVVIGRQKVHKQGDNHLTADLHTNNRQGKQIYSINQEINITVFYLYLK